MTIETRIAELTAAWEDAVNYGETEQTHRAADYVLSEDDYRAGLSDDEAAELVALIDQQAENQQRAERIARRVADAAWAASTAIGPDKSHDYNTALNAAREAALCALTERED